MSNGGASGIIFRKSTLRMGDRGADKTNIDAFGAEAITLDTQHRRATAHMLPQS